VEPEVALLRRTFEEILLEPILDDPRVVFVTPVDPSIELASWVRRDYTPFVDGEFRLIPLQSRVEADRERFQRLAEAATAACRSQERDRRAHAVYGRQWFRNAALNLAALPHITPVRRLSERSKGSTEALVAAAGPSLDRSLDRIEELSRSRLLVCCDTALGTLKTRGIEPDIVLTIDCQHATLLHFLGTGNGGALAASLASPPALLRGRSRSPYTLFASTHPFEQLLARSIGIPQLDMGTGSVTHSACKLAEELGAQEITLFGADFSYPFGRPYAKGTFFYDYIDARQNVFEPSEGRLYTFLAARGELERKAADDYWAFESPLLSRYRDELRTACTIPINRVMPDGTVEAIRPSQDRSRRELSPRSDPATHAGRSSPAQHSEGLPTESQVRSAFHGFLARLREMELSEAPLWSQLSRMGTRQRETVFSLLPLAAHFQALSHRRNRQEQTERAAPGHPLAALRSARNYAQRLFEAL
jgi:hypothetical protein